MSFRIDISDRLAIDPNVTGSPTAFDLFYDVDNNLENSEFVGSCVVYDKLEPFLGGSRDYYEMRGVAGISSLYICENFRHQGLGLQLLKFVMKYLYRNGIRYAELDDVSDYLGRPDCIYKKAGFNYDSDDNHMMANLRHCVVGQTVCQTN